MKTLIWSIGSEWIFFALGSWYWACFLSHYLNSITASYIYLIFIAVFSFFLSIVIEDNWLSFMPQVLWVFMGLILYYWLPKLKVAKDIGPRESIFGVLCIVAILSLAMFQLSGSSGLVYTYNCGCLSRLISLFKSLLFKVIVYFWQACRDFINFIYCCSWLPFL